MECIDRKSDMVTKSIFESSVLILNDQSLPGRVLGRVHPDDRIWPQTTFEFAIRDKRDFEQEFRIVTPDWSIRHLHGVGHAILNEANELVESLAQRWISPNASALKNGHKAGEKRVGWPLNAFVEELDVNRFLGDVIAELNKQFHAKFWELWLFDDAIGALVLHSTSHPSESVSPGIGRRECPAAGKSCGGSRQKRMPSEHRKSCTFPPRSLCRIDDIANCLRRANQNTDIRATGPWRAEPGFLELQFQSPPQFTSDDLELAQALVNHATLALQLNRLTRRAEELAVTEERNRLAREIHDTLAQAFAGIVLPFEALGTSLAVSKRRSAKALSQIQKLARSGLDEARRSVQSPPAKRHWRAAPFWKR